MCVGEPLRLSDKYISTFSESILVVFYSKIYDYEIAKYIHIGAKH